jgi:peptidyl carrier protein
MTGNHPGGLSPSEVEQLVTEIWKGVLGMRPGQEKNTFFELSGQSIAAVRIVARVEDEVGIAIDLGELFEDPDLAKFVGLVLAKVEGEAWQDKRSA